jgi:hypothetical protein
MQSQVLTAALLSSAVLRGEGSAVAAWIQSWASSKNVHDYQANAEAVSSALALIKDPSVLERFWRACFMLPGPCRASESNARYNMPGAHLIKFQIKGPTVLQLELMKNRASVMRKSCLKGRSEMTEAGFLSSAFFLRAIVNWAARSEHATNLEAPFCLLVLLSR